MSYIVPFQSVALFENTFKHQINKTTGKVDDRKFVFNRKFGDETGELPVEAGRYRLIWMSGCPHSNKAVITLRLLGLDSVISIGECGVLRDPRGWVFSEDLGEVDPVLKVHYLDDAYLKGDPTFVGRSTVPAIADVQTGAVVQNEAWEIPKYLVIDWERFHKENAPDLYPENLRTEIDETIEYIKKVNAYACGFARNQKTYDEGYKAYFDVLEALEERLSNKRFLHGDYVTLSDIHLYVALIRFHINYHLVFGVNKKRLEDYPSLWGYTRDLYQTEAFYEYTKLEWIKKHYQLSPHMRAKLGNEKGLLGVGPDNSKLLSPTGREKLSKDPGHKFNHKDKDKAFTAHSPLGREWFTHTDEESELRYLKNELLDPIEKAGSATFQTDLERRAFQIQDTLKAIDERLAGQIFLTGVAPNSADKLLYQTLLRHDYIYYYLYKLNFAKSSDYPNLARFIKDIEKIEEIKNSIDIEAEKRAAFEALSEERNPYRLVFAGPGKE
ncbi:MAG: glutathione S-transferase C-terminal domain-containing protein [Lachnospiraceae bacterium]|nr:glutathione S-transferase C-terminal domain-containing protein [Lachnospiraceae bacterium]